MFFLLNFASIVFFLLFSASCKKSLKSRFGQEFGVHSTAQHLSKYTTLEHTITSKAKEYLSAIITLLFLLPIWKFCISFALLVQNYFPFLLFKKSADNIANNWTEISYIFVVHMGWIWEPKQERRKYWPECWKRLRWICKCEIICIYKILWMNEWIKFILISISI